MRSTEFYQNSYARETERQTEWASDNTTWFILSDTPQNLTEVDFRFTHLD